MDISFRHADYEEFIAKQERFDKPREYQGGDRIKFSLEDPNDWFEGVISDYDSELDAINPYARGNGFIVVEDDGDRSLIHPSDIIELIEPAIEHSGVQE